MSNSAKQKQAAARAAIAYVEEGSIIGVGTGSTVNEFIDALADTNIRLEGAVSSSQASSARLRAIGVDILDLNRTGDIELYVDGADEVNKHGYMIKGGGAALTREKIVAEAARKFVCIADASKLVDVLGDFPLPIEVIPMARSLVSRKLIALGGKPELREGVTTDNGQCIIDVRGLDLTDPPAIERSINQIPGVVCNGIFALRGANVVILGTDDGVNTITI